MEHISMMFRSTWLIVTYYHTAGCDDTNHTPGVGESVEIFFVHKGEEDLTNFFFHEDSNNLLYELEKELIKKLGI